MESSWPYLDVVLDLHRPEQERVAAQKALVLLMQQKHVSIQDLVQNMGSYLSTTDGRIRSRATIFLSEILTQVRLEESAISALANFFISRLEDAAGFHGALRGCLALLKGSKAVSDKDALDMFNAAQLAGTQSLTQQDRMLCFELLDVLFERHSSALATLKGTLVWQLTEAIRGEKDPRCLLLAFRLVEHLGKLFPDPNGPIAGEATELFDTINCYFPISFNQRPGDRIQITKEDLILSLERAFTASAAFATDCMSFLFEKLESSVKDAKIQSLQFLGSYILAHAAVLVQDASAIWVSLKAELFPKLSLEYEKQVDPEVFNAATRCLSRCIRAFQLGDDSTGGVILRLLLEDEICNDFLRYLRQGGDVQGKDRLKATGQVFAAAAKASRLSCNVVASLIMPAFLSRPSLADADVLEVVVLLLESMRELSLERLDREWLRPFYPSFKQLLQVFSAGVPFAKGMSDGSTELLLKTCVSGLRCLASFHGYLPSLPEDEAYDHVSKLMEIAHAKEEYESCWRQAVHSIALVCKSVDESNGLLKNVVQNLVQGALSGRNDVKSSIFILTAISEASISAGDIVIAELRGHLLLLLDAPSSTTGNGGATGFSSMTLVLLLQSLAGVFQSCRSEGASRAALEVVLKIWCSLEMPPVGARLSEEVLHALADLVRVAVSLCDSAGQDAILHKALHVLSERPDACIVAVFSSVAVAVRPEFSTLQTLEIVQLLVKSSIEAEAPFVSHRVTEALASVVNKWCTTTWPLEELVQYILKELSAICGDDLQYCRAITTSAWVAKALAMRGHNKVADIVANLLRTLQNDDNTFYQDSDSVRRTAAKGLGVIVEDAGALSKEYFATIGPLYKQRFLNSYLEPLQQALRVSKSTVSRSWLLRGFGHVVVGVPTPALACEAKRVLPILIEVLPSLADDSQLLLGNVLVLSSFLVNDKNDIVVDHVSSIINSLTELTHYPHSMAVRQTAIQCLGALVALPYISVYPYTRQVFKTLHRALDDPKRAVRIEAGRCYQAWITLSSSEPS